MVDGDLYLIEMVKLRPPLWDKSVKENRDVQQKTQLWDEISKIIKLDKNWVRRRWSTLRERYVKTLKHISDSNINESSTMKHKYFDEMSFLREFIKFRDKPKTVYEESIINSDSPKHQTSNRTSSETATTKRFYRNENGSIKNQIVSEIVIENEEQKHDAVEEEFEFSITNEIIEENNDDDETNADQLFVELASDEDNMIECETQTHQNDHNYEEIQKFTIVEDRNPIKTEIEFMVKRENEKVKRKLEPEEYMLSEHKENKKQMKLMSHVHTTILEAATQTTISKKSQETQISCQCSASSYRCEDRIFGELITAMLLKLDDETKRKTKKEIMNLML